jgi:hypothetical protein
MEKKIEKVCGDCKKVFPLTGEYFYTKTTKKGTLIKGKPLSKDCISFRSVCKKCNTAQSLVTKRKKLMVKYNVLTDKELDEVIHASRIKSGKLGNQAIIGKPSPRRIHDYPENATMKEKSIIAGKIRIENLADNYLAAAMRFKLKDVPSEILEIKRKQLKFYRYVKSKKDQIRNNK